MSETEISIDQLQKQLKVRKLALEDGGSLLVRMPIRNVSIRLERVGENYRVDTIADEPVNEELKSRVDSWLASHLEREGADGLISKDQLVDTFRGLRQHYRRHNAPYVPGNLPDFSRPEPEVAEVQPCQTYPYKLVMDVLSGKRNRKDMPWGSLAMYGNECIKVKMPDGSTDLIVMRKHSHEGSQHWVFLSPGEGATPEVTAEAQSYIDRYMQYFTSEQSGGLLVGYTRQLLEHIRNMDMNTAIEPAPVKQGLIEV